MATYAVESSRQSMTATGIVEPVMAWIEEGGKRRPSKDAQDHDAPPAEGGTGLPLWGVEVMYEQTNFNRVSTVTAKVTVGAKDKPNIAKFSPVTFRGMTVEARIGKNGGFTEIWRAAELDHFQPTNAKQGEKAAA